MTARRDMTSMTRAEMIRFRDELRARAKQLTAERDAKRERSRARQAAGGRLRHTVRRDVLAILTGGPATDDAIASRHDELAAASAVRTASADLIRKTRIALTQQGLIIDTGSTTKTRAGRTAKLWRLAEPSEIVRPPYLDAWIRRITQTDRLLVFVVRCPYCQNHHHIRHDPHGPELVTPDCEQGPIRIRVPNRLREQLEQAS